VDKVIAYHKRSYEKNFVITEVKHMPQKHRVIAEENAKHLLDWSERVGPQTNVDMSAPRGLDRSLLLFLSKGEIGLVNI
jgi:hypothetical protein